MLSAFPVLPLLASTIVSPGCSSPSRSARSIRYLATRALIDPDGLRNSSLAQIPSTSISGVSPIASRIVRRFIAASCGCAADRPTAFPPGRMAASWPVLPDSEAAEQSGQPAAWHSDGPLKYPLGPRRLHAPPTPALPGPVLAVALRRAAR